MDDLPITEHLTIPARELRISFARSGGPGGQNVNKVETKVELRWNPSRSSALGANDRDWLLRRLAGKLTADGDLVVTSSRTRDQMQNREDARRKIARLLTRALERPKPRQHTRPTKASIARRIEEKKQRGRIKELRRLPPEDH